MDGTQEQYSATVDYLYLNAEDGGVGEETFAYYGLRGHPTLLYVKPDGEIVWQREGLIPQDELEILLESSQL